MLCASVIFAQNEKFNALMEEAKGYEEKKMWVTAAATYADAMSSQPDDCMDAAIRFNEITNAFINGKPGLDKYTSRMMHDEWKKILIEFEQYFSTHMARGIKISDIKGDAYGLKYKITFRFTGSKYTEIKDALTTGYREVREDSWTDMPYCYTQECEGYLARFSSWPQASASIPAGSVRKTILNNPCYSLVTNHAAYKVNGVAVIGLPMVKNIGWSDGTGPALGIFEYRNAFDDEWYDIKFKMVDNEGNTIKVSPRVFCKTRDKYDEHECVISGLTGEQYDMIELEEATFAVDSVYLQYGYVAPSGVISATLSNGYVDDDDLNKALKAAKNPMLEISIPPETVDLSFPDDSRGKFELAKSNCAEKIREIEAEEERKRYEDK